MNSREYRIYVEEECKRQWSENQEELYGKWEDQTDTEREDYYNQMFSDLADNLTKSCIDCCYLGKDGNENEWYCNCGSSENYLKIVTKEDIIECDDFEE